MTWVKICGITNLEDALMAVEAGADALGFVFYEKSPRKVDPDIVREIVKKLPDSVESVGVFAGDSAEHWPEIAGNTKLTSAQIAMFSIGYGSRDQSVPLQAMSRNRDTKLYPVWPADIFLDGRLKPEFPEPFTMVFDTIFLDSGKPEQPGGTGRPFDWSKAASSVETLKQNVKVVIAGGLNAGNVAEAMRILHPWGVDVASGVETSPGKKDPAKVKAFIAAVREADKVH